MPYFVAPDRGVSMKYERFVFVMMVGLVTAGLFIIGSTDPQGSQSLHFVVFVAAAAFLTFLMGRLIGRLRAHERLLYAIAKKVGMTDEEIQKIVT